MVEEKVIIKVSADTSEFKKGMKDASESAKDVKKSTDKTGAVAGDSISKASVNLNKSGDKLKGKFQGLGAKFSGLGEQITASLGKAVPGFDKITKKLKGAGKVGKAGLVAVGAAVAGVVGAIVAAILVIAAKLVKMAIDISGKFVKAFNPARFDAQMGKMKKSAERLKTTLGVFLEPLFKALTNGLSWIMDKLTAFLEGILLTVGFIGGLLGVMDGVARSMDDVANSMDEASMAADQGLASFDKLTTLGEITGDAEQAERLNKIMAVSARMAQELKRDLGSLLKEIPGKIASTFRGIVASIASSITSLGGKIKELFIGPIMGGLESARTAVGSWASSAGETLNGVWNDIGDGARSLWNGIGESAGRTWENISETSAGVWNTISSAGRRVLNSLSSSVGGFWGNVTEGGASAWESVKSIATNTWTNIRSKATAVFGGIRDILANTFSGPLDNIRESFGGLWGGFRSSAEEVIDGLADWVEDKFQKVIDAILAPVRWVIDKLENLLDFDMPSISDIIPSGGGSFTSKVVDTGGNVVNAIATGLGRLKFWADGGVAEPNNPFLAVLGDNRTEREVVTPVSLMRATMREVMLEMGTESSNRPINLDVNLDGRRIARATYDYMEMERRRRGA